MYGKSANAKEGNRMPHARPTKALLLLVLSLAIAALTACSSLTGTGDDAGEKAEKPPTPLETVRLAYKKTAAEQTASFAMTTLTRGIPGPDGEPMDLVMDMEGAGDFSGNNLQAVMVMPMLGQVEMRVLDGEKAYMKFPEEMTAQISPGKPWVVMDYKQIMQEQLGVSDPSQLQGAGQDPLRQFRYLRSVSDSVEKLGKEEVRGVPTTRYRAVVDMEKALSQNPAQRRLYEKTRETLKDPKVPMEIWLDKDDVVRRYKMDMTLNVPETTSGGGNGEARTTMTAEYFDFGAPLEVTPPPADQTIPYEQIMQQQTSATS